jgi:hypothetical protein
VGRTDRRANGAARPAALARRQEHERQRVEEIGLTRAARLRQPPLRHTLEALEDRRQGGPLGNGATEPFDDLLDRVGLRSGISGWPPLTDEKAHVPDDAVADLAESRQMDEQALLEQRRERTVQVGRLRELPELLDQSRRGVGGTEEARKNTEAVPDLTPEATRARLEGHVVDHSAPHLCEAPWTGTTTRDEAA